MVDDNNEAQTDDFNAIDAPPPKTPPRKQTKGDPNAHIVKRMIIQN